MLPAVVVAAITAALLSTVGLLTIRARRGEGGALSFSRRLVLALVGTGLVALCGALVAAVVTDDRHAARVAFAAVVVASLLWLPVTRRWNARAHLCWSANTLLYAAYLV